MTLQFIKNWEGEKEKKKKNHESIALASPRVFILTLHDAES